MQEGKFSVSILGACVIHEIGCFLSGQIFHRNYLYLVFPSIGIFRSLLPTEQQCELNLFSFMYIDPPLNAHLQGFNQFQLGKFVVH